jgi:hypothetical protein
VDLLRGVVMVVEALGHSRDFFHFGGETRLHQPTTAPRGWSVFRTELWDPHQLCESLLRVARYMPGEVAPFSNRVPMSPQQPFAHYEILSEPGRAATRPAEKLAATGPSAACHSADGL